MEITLRLTESGIALEYSGSPGEYESLRTFLEIEGGGEEEGEDAFAAICRLLFKTHAGLYRSLGIEARGLHSTCDDFNFGCDGFMRFTRSPAFDISKLTALFQSVIPPIVNKKVFCKLAIPIEPSPLVSSIEIPEEAVLIVKGQAYSLSFQKTKGIVDIPSYLASLGQQMENTFQNSLLVQKNLAMSKVETLKKEIEALKASSLRGALLLMDLAKNLHWKTKNEGFLWPRKIEMKAFIKQNAFYKAPKGYYLRGLFIPWDYPSNRVFAGKSRHPNVDLDGSVCLGDLNGASLETLLKKLPKMLETGNINDGFPNGPLGFLEDYLEKKKPKPLSLKLMDSRQS